jgi:hypothetical protein
MIYGLMAVYIGELQPFCNFCEPFLILKTHVSVFSLPLVLMSNWLPLAAWFSVSDLRVKNPYYEARRGMLKGYPN